MKSIIFMSLLAFGLTASAADSRPNIIIILADDMGYSDIGCYGSEIPTPNLDALARDGLRFTQFYNTARCCPTRASLLTGLYPHQAGVGHMTEDRGYESYRGRLNRHCVTIAEVLKSADYRTYAVGKWHVAPGDTAEALKDKSNWPLQRGFDRYYGTIHGAGSYWDPSSLVRDNTQITAFSDPDYRPEEFYYTDAISDHAIRFILDHHREHSGKPFFMYVAFTAAHWPMHAKAADIERHKGQYDAGYDAIRLARWKKQLALGVVDARWGLSPQAGNWPEVENPAFEARCMEVYAAMIESMDRGIGRIVESLRESGQFDNTLIFFLQDNGGCAEGVGRRGDFVARLDHPTLSPMEPDAPQYGSIPAQTRDGYPVRRGYGVMPGPADTFIAYGRAWANVSNTPFREYKHWVHEGGISTPLIVHWPVGIPSRLHNTFVHEPGHLIDLMATCVDVSGADYPEQRNGQTIHPPEGASLKPLLQGHPFERGHPLFWEHEGNRAIRDGRWKLVSRHLGRENGPWELYDMESDRAELNNLAARRPEVVKRLAGDWETWAEHVGALPWPVTAPANDESNGEQN